MRSLNVSVVVQLAALGCFAMAGCSGDKNTYYNVSGTVTYDGNPVPKGTIQFLPDATKQNAGPAGFANIENGQFDTKLLGKGTTGGAYYAVVNGFDGQADPGNELPLGKPLFTDYRISVDLPKSDTTQSFEITAAAVKAAQQKTIAPSEP